MPGVLTFSGCFVKWPFTQGGGSAVVWYTGGLISPLFSLVVYLVYKLQWFKKVWLQETWKNKNERQVKWCLDTEFSLSFSLADTSAMPVGSYIFGLRAWSPYYLHKLFKTSCVCFHCAFNATCILTESIASFLLHARSKLLLLQWAVFWQSLTLLRVRWWPTEHKTSP